MGKLLHQSFSAVLLSQSYYVTLRKIEITFAVKILLQLLESALLYLTDRCTLLSIAERAIQDVCVNMMTGSYEKPLN